MATRFKLARGTTAEWASVNPVLLEGEVGFEETTRKLKVGDGVTHWLDLEYVQGELPDDGGVSDAQILAHINSETPHPVYDDGPDLVLLYQNAKV